MKFLYVCDVPSSQYLELSYAAAEAAGVEMLLGEPQTPENWMPPKTEEQAIAQGNSRIARGLAHFLNGQESVYLVYKPVIILDLELSRRMFDLPFGELLADAPKPGDLINDKYIEACNRARRPVINYRTGYPFKIKVAEAKNILEQHPSIDFVQAYHAANFVPEQTLTPGLVPTIRRWSEIMDFLNPGLLEDADPSFGVECWLDRLSVSPFFLYEWRAHGPALNRMYEMALRRFQDRQRER